MFNLIFCGSFFDFGDKCLEMNKISWYMINRSFNTNSRSKMSSSFVITSMMNEITLFIVLKKVTINGVISFNMCRCRHLNFCTISELIFYTYDIAKFSYIFKFCICEKTNLIFFNSNISTFTNLNFFKYVFI